MQPTSHVPYDELEVPPDRIEAAGGDMEIARFMYSLELAGVAQFGPVPEGLPPDTVLWTTAAEARVASAD